LLPAATVLKLRYARSAFLIPTKRCCDQDVKVVTGAPSQKEHAIGAVLCKKEGMLLQPLCWRCVKSCAIHHDDRDVHEE